MAKLLDPITLAGLDLRNAIAVSPMSRMQAHDDGTPSSDMAAYYARFARSGAGLVFSEAAYVDEVASRAYFRQPGLANDAQAGGWRRVTDAVHKDDGRIVAQLQHGGRLAEPGLNPTHLSSSDGTAAGNSWQTNSPNRPARAASPADICAIVEAFAAAARRAVAAGFDGVEIHGARGYLVDDFLSASTNQRADSYGGALEGRLKLPGEILRAVRAVIGARLLSFNLSLYKMDDIHYQAPGGRSEIEQIVRSLRKDGADIIHVSTRRVLADEPWGASLAQTVKAAAPDRTVIANGGIKTLDDAQSALDASGADLVAVARAFLANPDWINRGRQKLPLAKYARGLERQPLFHEPHY